MYIGIIGHTGDDKLKLSQLIGETVNWIATHKEEKKNPSFDFCLHFYEWCDELDKDGAISNPSQRVYYASFSHPLKMVVSMITGIPFELFNDPVKKNTYIININSLDYKELENETLISPEKLFRNRNRNLSLEDNEKQELSDSWMSLNNYVIYFGYYLCRNYIGRDIWTKVERISNGRFGSASSPIRIYTDIRTLSEYDYIREKEGSLIRISSDSQKSDENSIVYEKLLSDAKVDGEIHYRGSDFRGLCILVYSICYNIVRNSE